MKDDWILMDKTLAKTLPEIDRPYSRIEAAFSLAIDMDRGTKGTISEYSKMWGWSRGKVRWFVNKTLEEGQ